MELKSLLSLDLSKKNKPYEDMWKYFEDCSKLLNFGLLSIIITDLKRTPADIDFLKADNDENYYYANEIISLLLYQSEVFVHQLKSEDFESQFKNSVSYINSRRKITTNSGVFLPDVYIMETFELSEFEREVVLNTFLTSLDSRYEKIFAYLNKNNNRMTITPEIIIKLFSDGKEAITSFIASSKLMLFFFKDIKSENSAIVSAPLILNQRILDFFISPVEYDADNETYEIYDIQDELEPLIINHELLDYSIILTQSALQNEKTIINISGIIGSGKKFLLHHVCKRNNRRCININLSSLLERSGDLKTRILQISCEAILQYAFISIEVQEINDEAEIRKFNSILSHLFKWTSLIFIIGKTPIPAKNLSDDIVFEEVRIPATTSAERIMLWGNITKNINLDEDVVLSEIVTKFEFSPGQIIKSFNGAVSKMKQAGKDSLNARLISNACFEQITHNLSKTAVKVVSNYSWDDIILPEKEIKNIKAACNHVKYKYKVFDEWGYDKKLDYGRGLSMLFAGPSGTGKTLAAHVVANELKMEMYRIQISKIVSKYIGETEKNLQAIFEEAKKSSVILFFDETDALFSKRSEVTSSNDRYANVEVAYLLQQMEEHEGVTILTTNLLSNIDSAFLRRISYIINFPFNSQSMREQIWKQAFPAKVPLSNDIDFSFLSTKFEVSGGAIKNIALNATFNAAACNEIIGMSHILQAAIHEVEKSGKIINASDLGVYANLFF